MIREHFLFQEEATAPPSKPPRAGKKRRPAKKARTKSEEKISSSVPAGFEETFLFEHSLPVQPHPRLAPKEKLSEKVWQPPRGFRVYGSAPSPSPESYRVHRKAPVPEMLDELMVRVLPEIPSPSPRRVLCLGSVLPAVAAAAAQGAETFDYCCSDPDALKALSKLAPSASCHTSCEDILEPAKYTCIVACEDALIGRLLVEKIIDLANCLQRAGRLVVAAPSDYLLDYTTNVRTEAPQMRDRIHRACRTHFILRPTATLMQPSWDILVLSKRLPGSVPPKNRWRMTGTGFLPWQKCNEAISSAPWLLVEAYDQIAPAIARCVSYPWEGFDALSASPAVGS